ncbi:hypothetical protein Bca101_067434 [Brassica carinata]
MQEDSSLRRDLTAANRVIEDHKDKFRAMAHIIDLMLESNAKVNPSLASTWQTLRPTFNPDPPPEEQADLERCANQRGSEIFDEVNLNNP